MYLQIMYGETIVRVWNPSLLHQVLLILRLMFLPSVAVGKFASWTWLIIWSTYCSPHYLKRSILVFFHYSMYHNSMLQELPTLVSATENWTEDNCLSFSADDHLSVPEETRRQEDQALIVSAAPQDPSVVFQRVFQLPRTSGWNARCFGWKT